MLFLIYNYTSHNKDERHHGIFKNSFYFIFQFSTHEILLYGILK